MNTRLDPTALLPTLADIEAAAEVVYRDFAATPQYRWALLSQRLGRVINQYPPALAPQCGWMREGGRSQ